MAATPFLYVLAGPNGSGKSTLAAALRAAYPEDSAVWINADEIAAEMRLVNPAGTDVALQAAIEADARRMGAIAQREPFMTETVMSDIVRWFAFFRHAKAAGYHITLYFVTTANPSINVGRVAARSALGGHSVPEDRIRSRYTKVMHESLPLILPLCDRALLFDNSAVEHGPLLIADYSDGGLLITPDAMTSRLEQWLWTLLEKMGLP